MYLDDDLILTPNWFQYACGALISNRKVAAVSGQVVFGYGTNKVLEKMFRKVETTYSGGCMIMKRETIINIGGWDPTIHWGEDAELYHRINENGLQWICSRKAVTYHPMTVRQYFNRAHTWGTGLAEAYKRHSKKISLKKTLLKRLGAIFIRSIILAVTVHPKLLWFYSIERTLYLKAFISALRK